MSDRKQKRNVLVVYLFVKSNRKRYLLELDAI